MPEDRRLVPQLTVEENVLLPSWVTRGVDGAARLDLVYGLMPEVAAMRHRKALVLSGGQQKLVALARALIDRHASSAARRTLRGRRAGAVASGSPKSSACCAARNVAVLIAQSDLNHSVKLLDREYLIERGANRERRAEQIQANGGDVWSAARSRALLGSVGPTREAYSPKSSGCSAIGMPCGVRSQARCHASRVRAKLCASASPFAATSRSSAASQ